MSVISSIQSAAGNAATSARVAVTRGFREEVEGLAAAALGKKDETVEKLSAVEQRARQAANVAKLAVTTWLNTTGWGRILTNKYARTGALILITVLIIGLFYFSVAYIGLITMVQQDVGGAISTMVESGGCVLLSEKEDLVCGVELVSRLFETGAERIGLGSVLQEQACYQGAERVGGDPNACT